MAVKDRKWIGGSGKMHVFADNSHVINLFLKLEDLVALPQTDKGYIRIVAGERKDPDKYGNTHYLYEDEFVPKKSVDKGHTDNPVKPDPTPSGEEQSDDLPF